MFAFFAEYSHHIHICFERGQTKKWGEGEGGADTEDEDRKVYEEKGVGLDFMSAKAQQP